MVAFQVKYCLFGRLLAMVAFPLILILFAGKAWSQKSQSDFSLAAPAALDSLQNLRLWASRYFIYQFHSCGSIDIVDQNGRSLGVFADTCHFCEAVLAGSALVTSSGGKVTHINYAGRGKTLRVNCRACPKFARSRLNVESWGRAMWLISSGFGIGVDNFRLVPYRTIAVDKSVIPYGSVLYIPQARGRKIRLPNGSHVVHDGYFFAADRGGAVNDVHIDIFTGTCRENPFGNFVKSHHDLTFDAYLVTDTTIIKALTRVQVRR